MKNLLKERSWLFAQLPIALLAPIVLSVGATSVGQAAEIPTMTITAERPVTVDATSDYRDEIQARARVVVWKTRFKAMSDLGLKLNSENPSSVRLAGNFTGKRG